jgi:hypothetical protein
MGNYPAALAIWEEALGKDHPATVKTAKRIAELHEIMGGKQ